MTSLTEKLRRDLAWFKIVDKRPCLPKGGPIIILLRAFWKSIFSDPIRAVLLYRLSNAAWTSGHKIIAYYFLRRLRKRFCSAISPAANIGAGLRLPHPVGVVIGAGVELGQMVTVNQHVTLGGNMGNKDESGNAFPRVGNWCWIAAGAVVVGPVAVGEDVIIGANAVVTRDVQDHTVVGGVPAKLIREKSPDLQYFGYRQGDRSGILQ